jgi:hypothetical protein
MGCQVTMQGAITIPGGGCGCSGSGTPSTKVQGLGFACSATTYPAVQSTDCPSQITTSGAVGDNWRELPATEGLSSIYLLMARGSSPFRLRIGADAAKLTGAGGTFPTSFAGGELFGFTADGTAVPVTFTSGAQTALQVAAEINQAAIGAGLDWLPASVLSSGQLQLSGKATGGQGSLVVTTTNATIGFPSASTVAGAGSDLDSQGLFLNQFDQSNAPSRVQVSGNTQIEVFAAGVAA